MITSESLKGRIRNIATSKKLTAQEILQMFFFERVIERISISDYRKNFIIKGGQLVASLAGVSRRTSYDLDSTVQGLPMDESVMENIFREILEIDCGDGVRFEFSDIVRIRENDVYEDFRIKVVAFFGKIVNPMTIDLTTGDVITPKPVEYSFNRIFDDGTIPVLAYPIETVMGEKLESVISRGNENTRMRDFYDLFLLYRTRHDEIDMNVLRSAVIATAEHRHKTAFLDSAKVILEDLRVSPDLDRLWTGYVGRYSYAADISFHEVIDVLKKIVSEIEV